MSQFDDSAALSHDNLKRGVYLSILLALLLPPFVGGGIMGLIGFFPLPAFYGVFFSYSGLYVAAVLTGGLWFGRFAIGKIQSLERMDPARQMQTAQLWFGRFPWLLLLFLSVYSAIGAYSADISLVSMGVWQYDWPHFKITILGVVPAVLISAVPVFFGFSDLIGRYLAPRGVQVMAIPLWTRLLMLGLMTPFLIDSMLIGYFYNRTGYFENETLLLWFSLLCLAAVSTYLAWVSMRQGMLPFERVMRLSSPMSQAGSIVPQTLDELGVLAKRWGEMLAREKQLTAAAHESEQRAQLIFEQAASGIAVVGLDGRLLQVNPRIQQMLGYSAEELSQMNFRDIVDPLDVEKDQVLMNALMQGTQSSYSLEKRYIGKGGQYVWVNLTASLARDANGQPAYFIKVVEDIGQRKAHEAEMRRLLDTLDTAQDLIATADTQGRLQYLNAGGRAMLGISRDEDVHGQPIADYHPAEETQRLMNIVFPLCAEEGSWEGETVFQRRNGSTFTALQSIVAHRSENGEIAYFSTVTHDITERLKADEAVKHERNFVNTVLDNAAALIVVLDRDGRIRRFNRACEKLSGYSFADAEGRCVWDFLLLPEEAEKVREQAFHALRENPQALSGSHTNYWVSRAGESHLIEWSNSVLLDNDGAMEYMVGIGIDVTEQRETEAALKRSEETYARAEAITHIGSWDWNILTNALHWTDEIYRIFGQTPQSFPATYPAFLEAVHPDDRQAVIDAVGASVADANVTYSIEHRVVRPDGQLRIVQERGKVYRNEQGQPVRMIGTVNDITERKEAELEFRSILQTTPEGYWLVSPERGRLLDVNEAYCQMSGYSREELLQMCIPDLDAVENPQQVAEHMAAIMDGKSVRFDTVHRRKDGSLFDVAVSAKYVETRGGVFVGMLRDITERKQAENALRSSEKKYRELHESVRDGFVRVGMAGNILEFNQAYQNMLGYSAEELQRLTYVDLTPEKWHGMEEDIVQNQILPRGYSDIYKKAYRHKDGHIFPIELRTYLVRDDNGQPASMWAIVRDITERERLNDELLRHREHLEELVEERSGMLQEAQRIAHMGNWKWDVATGAIAWSDEIYRIFGYAPGEFMPTYERFMATVHPEDVERIKQSEQEAFAKGNHHSIDHRIVLPNGEIRWVHEEAVSNVGADGKPLSLSGTVQDITQRKQIEEALVKAKDVAERASKGKSEFLSRMSHELRTPMNAILGFAQVLETEALSGEQQDFVKEIHQAGRHLLDLINELLDLSRIEAGRFSLVIKPVKLALACEQAIQLVNPLLRQKDISLLNKCVADVSALADLTRVKQVLVNLLTNAAKYNRQGGSIRLEYELGNEMLRIKVSDSGIGIPTEKLSHLFVPFERLGAEFTGVDGTGIGLALSKHLVEMMGGQIGVDSQPGQGSCFWFELPLAVLPGEIEQSAEKAREIPEAKFKVLYVEDNAANLKVVEAMLRREPTLTLLSATDGEYGLELARRYHPDVILLDIHLPGMDGYAVLKALRANDGTCDIPVVALSADAMPIDIEKGLAAGFQRYLTKPVKTQELVETIVQLLQMK